MSSETRYIPDNPFREFSGRWSERPPTVDELAAQVMAIGFDGLDPGPELQAWVDRGLGGVALFSRNVESPAQVARLCAEFQRRAERASFPGLLIGIDQEGGRVARLTSEAGFSEFPPAMALGDCCAPQDARATAQAMAREMRSVGINADFAPVLDVNNNAANPVIGTRSFGAEPGRVAEFGVAFLNGLQEEGVLAFGKHFPGHGDTTQDSHFTLPVVGHTLERLEAVEFVPFRAAVRAGVGAIMSTHISFPAVEPSGLPGTLSERVMTGLIREEFGFTGMLATDSLEMGALSAAGYPAALAAAQALKSGADLLLFNNGEKMHREAYSEILAWVADGRIPLSRLEEAALRVLKTKKRFGMLHPRAFVGDPTAVCADPRHRELARALAARTVRVVRQGLARLPLPAALVVEFPGLAGLGARLGFAGMPFPGEPPSPAAGEIAAHATPYLNGGGALLLPLLDAAVHHPAQIELARALAQFGMPVIAAALRSPADLRGLPENVTALAVYSTAPPSLDALAALLHQGPSSI